MQTVEGVGLEAKYLSCLERGETATFAAWLAFASVNGGDEWKHPLLLLTDKRLIVSKERLFGRPRVDFAVTWAEVSTVRSGPWSGTFSPLIQLDVLTLRGTLALPVKNIIASNIEGAIREGYLSNPNHPAHRRS